MGKVKVAKGDTWESIAARTSGEETVTGIVNANKGAKKDKAPEAGTFVEVPGYGMENDNDTENEVELPETAAQEQAEEAKEAAAKKYAGPERRTAASPRRKVNSGPPTGTDRRTGPADRRATAS